MHPLQLPSPFFHYHSHQISARGCKNSWWCYTQSPLVFVWRWWRWGIAYYLRSLELPSQRDRYIIFMMPRFSNKCRTPVQILNQRSMEPGNRCPRISTAQGKTRCGLNLFRRCESRSGRIKAIAKSKPVTFVVCVCLRDTEFSIWRHLQGRWDVYRHVRGFIKRT